MTVPPLQTSASLYPPTEGVTSGKSRGTLAAFPSGRASPDEEDEASPGEPEEPLEGSPSGSSSVPQAMTNATNPANAADPSHMRILCDLLHQRGPTCDSLQRRMRRMRPTWLGLPAPVQHQSQVASLRQRDLAPRASRR